MTKIVYCIYDADGALLYVGCSGIGFGRLTAHARSKGWWPDVATVRIEHFDDIEDALRHEAKLIAELEPRCNVVLPKTFKGYKGKGYVGSTI